MLLKKIIIIITDFIFYSVISVQIYKILLAQNNVRLET
jgi:hypothetical protein